MAFENTIDTPDEELHGASFLIVGRASTGRHELVIFGAEDTFAKAQKESKRTAAQFPGKPTWIFKLVQEDRAEVVVNSTMT